MPSRHIVRRSSVVAGTALCAGLLSASLGAHAATSSSTWPQAGGDAAHSNRNNNETAITSGNVAQVHGQYSLGRLHTYGYCAAPYAPSAVASPTAVYYFDGRRIIASDIVTGQRLWRSEDLGGSDGTIISGLAVAGSRVILQKIGSCRSESDPGGVLLGYDVNTGSRAWIASLADRDVSMVVSWQHRRLRQLRRLRHPGSGVQCDHWRAAVAARRLRLPSRRAVRLRGQHPDQLRRDLLQEARRRQLDQAGRMEVPSR